MQQYLTIFAGYVSVAYISKYHKISSHIFYLPRFESILRQLEMLSSRLAAIAF